MKPEELIGKRITDILIWSKMETGGLDQAEVFIQVENKAIIGIPNSFDCDIEKKVDKKVVSLFTDLSDYPVYHVNAERSTIAETVNSLRKRESSWIRKIIKILKDKRTLSRIYKPYKIEFVENKIKYLKNQIIIEVILFEDPFIGFIELENGFIFTETTMFPNGAGMAGLNFYQSLNDLEKEYGTEYKCLTTWLKENH